MEPYWWSVIGLLLDIVGAFLLAVEAIKLENLRVVRDRVLRPLSVSFRSPLITFHEADGPGPGPGQGRRSNPSSSTVLGMFRPHPRENAPADTHRNRRPTELDEDEEDRLRGFGSRLSLFVLFHYFMVVAVLALVELFGHSLGIRPLEWTLRGIWRLSPWAKWPIFGLGCSLFVVILPLTLGCWAHTGLERLTELIIAGLDAIDRETPNGTIGILGFLLLFLGFLGQVAGSIASAP
jgi:hypothetical protein